MRTREIHLASRPQGAPTPEDFRLVETELPELGPAELLVETLVMSVDPYMRNRMREMKSYVPPFQLDAPLDGGAVGRVLASNADGFVEGDVVVHGLGWREHAIVPARTARTVDLDVAPASAYLGVLGMPGFTGWIGLTTIAEHGPDDVVYVSAAAGAVGSLVGQLARLRGSRHVVGSAGSPEKIAWLTDELGYTDAFDYHDADLTRELKARCPDGIDVYFDNVGGSHLEAALGRMSDFGRIALCGAAETYNATTPPPGPRTIGLAITRRLKLQGFIVSDHWDRFGEFAAEVGGYLADGRITYRETVVEGLDQAPEAFIGLLEGANVGKMLVRLTD
ncbi:MAG: NADP-dependent oxidoreductase [Actinobacteria bacterium]|nr:NADP-dependent oxidoreductase [Actinomycetota bacterium]